MTALLVGLFGGLGAAARFVLDGVIRARFRTRLPLATMIINVTGSFVIGVLVSELASGALADDQYLVAATGFCGGFTTFSTAMVETVRLIQTREFTRAVVNLLGTLVLAVVAVALGVAVGSMW